VNDGFRDLGVSSHFPVLAAAVYKTQGDILELGCGYGSTPMLKLMCRFGVRSLESYDNNKEWAASFGATHVEDWSKWEPKGKSYGVCFIDCSPGEERKDLIARMKGRAKFIIAHDHEAGSAAAYYYEQVMPRFKYAEVYRVIRPHTLILSDDEPFGLNAWDQGNLNA
jgi:hypothetical protein